MIYILLSINTPPDFLAQALQFQNAVSVSGCHPQSNHRRQFFYKMNLINQIELLYQSPRFTAFYRLHCNTSTHSFGIPFIKNFIILQSGHWDESQQINNPKSAHYQFWNQKYTQRDDNTDNNTACMACHTHTHLNITMLRLEDLIANHTNATAEPYEVWTLTVNVIGVNTT